MKLFCLIALLPSKVQFVNRLRKDAPTSIFILTFFSGAELFLPHTQARNGKLIAEDTVVTAICKGFVSCRVTL